MSYEFFLPKKAKTEAFYLITLRSGPVRAFWANFDIFKRSCLCLYMAYFERAGSFLTTGLLPNAHPGPETAHSMPKLLKYSNNDYEMAPAVISLINQVGSFGPHKPAYWPQPFAAQSKPLPKRTIGP